MYTFAKKTIISGRARHRPRLAARFVLCGGSLRRAPQIFESSFRRPVRGSSIVRPRDRVEKKKTRKKKERIKTGTERQRGSFFPQRTPARGEGEVHYRAIVYRYEILRAGVKHRYEVRGSCMFDWLASFKFHDYSYFFYAFLIARGTGHF